MQRILSYMRKAIEEYHMISDVLPADHHDNDHPCQPGHAQEIDVFLYQPKFGQDQIDRSGIPVKQQAEQNTYRHRNRYVRQEDRCPEEAGSF